MPVGLRFSLLHRAFRKRMDEMLAAKELTGVQFGTLGALMRMESEGREEISQKDLEAATHMTHATMTELLKRLEKKDFLRCEQSRRDRRFKCIRATEKAYTLREQMAELEGDTFRWLCRGLDERQIASLLESVDLMLKNAYSEEKGCDCGRD